MVLCGSAISREHLHPINTILTALGNNPPNSPPPGGPSSSGAIDPTFQPVTPAPSSPPIVPQPLPPATHDTCGYCGKSFPNPPDWDARTDHLITEHKFGECNQHKKFFRADHFRQHLKHSHGAGSGKWTNVLENTCMRDEPLPTPMAGRGPSGISGGMGMGGMGMMDAGMGRPLAGPGAIACGTVVTGAWIGI